MTPDVAVVISLNRTNRFMAPVDDTVTANKYYRIQNTAELVSRPLDYGWSGGSEYAALSEHAG